MNSYLTYFNTSEGDMFPFASVIRATYSREITRVYFVNGCIDLRNDVDGDFYGEYEIWLQNQN